MKVDKQKVLGIIASAGLSASVLSACSNSSSLVTKDNYKDYQCDKPQTGKEKVQCKDDNGGGSGSGSRVIYVPSKYVGETGQIKSDFVKSSANVTSGSKGLGSSRGAVES